jgi:hypothetical protein
MAYTLQLTRGTHLVGDDDANRIRVAIAQKAPTVDVRLDPFGGRDAARWTTIVTAHIILLTETPEPAVRYVPTRNGMRAVTVAGR